MFDFSGDGLGAKSAGITSGSCSGVADDLGEIENFHGALLELVFVKELQKAYAFANIGRRISTPDTPW